MAAYAAVVSLSNLIEQIQLYQPFLFAEQRVPFESVCTKVCYLQEFLETHTIADAGIAEDLESRILEVVHAAEDILESHIVDDIHERRLQYEDRDEISVSHDETSFVPLCEELHKAIGDMDLVEKEVMKIKEDGTLQAHQPRDISNVDVFRAPPSDKDVLVGLDEKLYQMLDMLTSCQPKSRQVIPITGMGGIGKTTLAKHVYDNPTVNDYFDVRRWVTISEKYNVEKILSELLGEEGEGEGENLPVESKGFSKGFDHRGQRGEKLHKHLFNRRYLIVLDDIWSTEVWDKLRPFFPNNDNGSRVLITTRLTNMTGYFGSSVYEMSLLEDDKGWQLLCATVFSQGSCPEELEEIGREIAKKCSGLPLSISVIGGLLAENKKTRSYWESIVKDISRAISMDENNRCLGVVGLSYSRLPVHLKPCFLYMGVFREDKEIRVSELIKLWVAEGFLKPISGKIMEDVAKDYLKDLIGRNLVIVGEAGRTGDLKFCKVHDLVRDLSLGQAERERFLQSTGKKPTLYMKSSRRIADYGYASDFYYNIKFYSGLQSESFPRSLICSTDRRDPQLWTGFEKMKYKLFNMRLSRILRVGTVYYPEKVFRLVNLRYFCFQSVEHVSTSLSRVTMLWNLQTIIISADNKFLAPPAIWEMKCLRHIIVRTLILPDPSSQPNDPVLDNLQTVSYLEDFRFTDEFIRRIPNVKTLKLLFREGYEENLSRCCLDNLVHLTYLQSLTCEFGGRVSCPLFDFPESLKKLTLNRMVFDWKDLTEKIVCLRYLENLVLKNCYTDKIWELDEEQFSSLKHMKLHNCNLTSWSADSDHFPCLVGLELESMKDLVEIPCDLGEITTFCVLKLKYCGKHVVKSAKHIQKEQLDFGNNSIRLLLESNEDDNDDENDDDEEEEGDGEEETK